MAQAGRTQKTAESRINDRIRAPKVRLIGADGSQAGIVTLSQALGMAQDANLDLVEVAPNADPPVCKIMDYGKFKYQESIRQKEARKKQGHQTVKEIRFRPKIGVHDYETKKGLVTKFLDGGHRVKVTVMFRGREMHHTELGNRILVRLAEDLDGTGAVEVASKLDGRNMTMMFAPVKKKPEKTEAAKPEPEKSEPEKSEPEEPGKA
ncbi:MAG: translation initiation factor IF-3 [Actinomycetota bacterium]